MAPINGHALMHSFFYLHLQRPYGFNQIGKDQTSNPETRRGRKQTGEAYANPHHSPLCVSTEERKKKSKKGKQNKRKKKMKRRKKRIPPPLENRKKGEGRFVFLFWQKRKNFTPEWVGVERGTPIESQPIVNRNKVLSL